MALAGLTVLATPAQAVTLVSNTGQTDYDWNFFTVTSTTPYAQQFTTGTNPDGYTLSEVVVNIRAGGVATPTFSIHTSSSNRPDTNVVNLTGSVSTAGLQSFVPASVTTLTPATKYYVVFSISSGDAISLGGTDTNDEDPGAAAGWSIANYYLYTTSGSWSFSTQSMEIAIKGTVQTTSTTNAAPTASNRTVTTNEDTDYTFAAANFNFADTDSGAALSSVKIVTLPAPGKGTLKLDGSAIAAANLPQTVSKADIDAGKLIYTPPANANGSGYASFTFKVNDGTDDSASAYTLTLDVTALNDPATGTPTITGTATVGQTLTAVTSAIMDADGLTGPTYAYQWIRVATDSTETDISGATSSTYTLVADDEGKTIKVKVSFSDDAGNPETLTSAATAAVGAANAAPTASNGTVTTDEDTDYTFAAANFNFADTDSGAALSSVKIVTLPASGKGTLKLSGTNVTANATVTKAQLDAGNLKYTPPANANGSGYASFTFKVNDGADDSASAYTLTLDVTAVNDPATGTPTITGTAAVGQMLTAATSAIMDADGLTSATYAYQWIRVATDSTETDISGATSSGYTLVADDHRKTIKVKVSFTDADGNPETLTSTATAVVNTPPGRRTAR